MLGYLKRLATAGAAYQAADIVSRLFAVATLPLYTRHLSRGDYGTAETLVAGVVLLSIPLRFGLGEAFVRYYFEHPEQADRDRIARASIGAVAAVSTVVALALLAVAGPFSQLVLGHTDATIMGFSILGLWAFSNLEMGKALLRVDERKLAFLAVTVGNVVLTVALTVVLVVVKHDGARGLVAGNFVASAVAVLALWVALRGRLLGPASGARVGELLRFGLPTIPADASVFALNVLDRAYLLRGSSASAAGLYALSVKLSSVVIVAVRGFQYAFPPLAYSIESDEEAGQLYSLVTTYYVLATGWVVAGVTLLGRWVVRALAAPSFYGAHRALPWVALGWALYGLFLIFVVIAGRAKVTTRNFPAAAAGLAVNAVLLVVLVGPLGIAGAGIALCASYLVMLVVMYALTRHLFTVAFEWARLGLAVVIVGGLTLAGELLLPTDGVSGFASRAAVFGAIPLAMAVSGFLSQPERRRLRELRARARPRPDGR